jgi:hypothetical protein
MMLSRQGTLAPPCRGHDPIVGNASVFGPKRSAGIRDLATIWRQPLKTVVAPEGRIRVLAPTHIEDEAQLEGPSAAVRARQLGNPARLVVGALESIHPLLE